MESKTINTIEINGKTVGLSNKMVEIPREKKFFETSNAYSKYLESVLKEAFPYDENLHSIEDYDYFIDYNVYKLWEAVDENKETLGKKVSKKFKKFNNEEKEVVVEEEEETKTTLVSKLLKPFKFIGKVIILPFTLAFKLGKTIGKTIRKGAKWINSKMPWSKKNKEDLDEMLAEAIENDNDNNLADEMLNEAEEQLEKEAEAELKKGINEELAKQTEEEAKKLVENLATKVEELQKENQMLRNRIEIYKKQPERDKAWEKYFQEKQEKENAINQTRNQIKVVENDMDEHRYRTYKPVIINGELINTGSSFKVNRDGKMFITSSSLELSKTSEEKLKTPYTITKSKNSVRVYKSGIKQYQDSQKLSETEDTITITGTVYENLLYSEYEFNVHMRDMAVNAYKVPFYKVDYNYDGLIKKNKEKIGGKVVNASVVLTKERYKELVENASKYFSLMGEVSNYSSNELENNNQKKLVK